MTLKPATNYQQIEPLQKQLNYAEKQLSHFKKLYENQKQPDNSFFQNQIKELTLQVQKLQQENTTLTKTIQNNDKSKLSTTYSQISQVENNQAYKDQIQHLNAQITQQKIQLNNLQKDNEKLYKSVIQRTQIQELSQSITAEPKNFISVKNCENCQSSLKQLQNATSQLAEFDQVFKEKKLLLLQIHMKMKEQSQLYNAEIEKLQHENNKIKCKYNSQKANNLNIQREFQLFQNDFKQSQKLNSTQKLSETTANNQFQAQIDDLNEQISQFQIEVEAYKHDQKTQISYQNLNEKLKSENLVVKSRLKEEQQRNLLLQRRIEAQELSFSEQIKFLKLELNGVQNELVEVKNQGKQARKLQRQDELISELMIVNQRDQNCWASQVQFLVELENVVFELETN